MRGCSSTLDVPRLKLIKIDLTNHIQIDLFVRHFLSQIVVQKLLFRWMESETWRNLRLAIYG